MNYYVRINPDCSLPDLPVEGKKKQNMHHKRIHESSRSPEVIQARLGRRELSPSDAGDVMEMILIKISCIKDHVSCSELRGGCWSIIGRSRRGRVYR